MAALLLACLTGACTQSPKQNEETFARYAGEWKITKAVRNLDDITNGCDFGRLLITLNKDGSYTVEKTALFAVTRNGVWTTKQQNIIVLTPHGAADKDVYEMQANALGDSVALIANFTTGSDNTYHYILKKIASKEKAKP